MLCVPNRIHQTSCADIPGKTCIIRGDTPTSVSKNLRKSCCYCKEWLGLLVDTQTKFCWDWYITSVFHKPKKQKSKKEACPEAIDHEIVPWAKMATVTFTGINGCYTPPHNIKKNKWKKRNLQLQDNLKPLSLYAFTTSQRRSLNEFTTGINQKYEPENWPHLGTPFDIRTRATRSCQSVAQFPVIGKAGTRLTVRYFLETRKNKS